MGKSGLWDNSYPRLKQDMSPSPQPPSCTAPSPSPSTASLVPLCSHWLCLLSPQVMCSWRTHLDNFVFF